MKRFIIAVMFSAMATFATDARATNITTVNFQSSGTISDVAIHIDNNPNPFTDTFDYPNVAGLNSVDVFFSNFFLFSGGQSAIGFTSATLFSDTLFGTVTPLSISPPAFGFITPSPLILTGPLRLVLTGITNATLLTPGAYITVLNVTPVNVTPVPEPASLMLLGAGLAGIGIWRRKAAR